MIFVCSPYKGDIEHNVEQARRYCKFVIKKGEIPLAPHLYFPQFLDDNDPIQRNKGIETGMRMMYDCSEVWVFGDVISEGMRREIAFAKQIGKAVKHFGTGCDL